MSATNFRKRMMCRVASMLNCFVLGCLVVRMFKEPKIMTAVVMAVLIAAIYACDREREKLT